MTDQSVDQTIPVASPIIGELERKYVNEALESNEVSSRGKFVTAFENEFALAVQAQHGIATCNGTSALHLALLATGIGPGDEVIVPPLTFVATANAVKYVGAQPIFIDIDPKTWNIDLNLIQAKITPKTRAIIPVHLFGNPVDMDFVNGIADKYNLAIIEDAAEAHGAEFKGKRVGAIGTVGIFSFYGNKILTTGEGGMLTTNDPTLAQRAKTLRDHGADPHRRYWHPEVGYNYRMTNLQGALGLAQLTKLDQFITRKREIANLYRESLKDLQNVMFQSVMTWASPVYWMVSIVLDNREPMIRDRLMQELSLSGIETRPFFTAINTMPPYQSLMQSCPIAERIAKTGLSLPSSASLSNNQVKKVAEAVKTFFKKGQGQ